MAGDYSWSDMPQELALRLKAFTDDGSEHNGGEVIDWLLNEMKTCAATPNGFTSLRHPCSDLPEVGSEFCKAHMPKEDIDDPKD